jgi:hypothetical protein
MIVFAGMTGRQEQIDAFLKRKPEAWMASYGYVRANSRSNKWDDEILPQLEGWPHYRYLDSGTFTFLRRAQTSRLGMGSRREAEIEANKKRGSVVTLNEVMEHLQNYIDYLDTHLHIWDYVFECDVDGIPLVRKDDTVMDGIHFTEWSRVLLRDIAGDKLMPVWHALSDNGDFTKFKALCEDYPYIGIGSDIKPDWRPLRYLIDYAHKKGVLLHGLGTSKVDILDRMPYDTVDSSTWISSARFGQYAGQSYTAKPRKVPMGAKELSRAQKFEDYVRSLGEDPANLLLPREHAAKYVVTLALFQDRQAAAPPVSSATQMTSEGLALREDSGDDESF